MKITIRVGRETKEVLVTKDQGYKVAQAKATGARMIQIPNFGFVDSGEIKTIEEGFEPLKKIDNRIESKHQQTPEEYETQRKMMENIRRNSPWVKGMGE